MTTSPELPSDPAVLHRRFEALAGQAPASVALWSQGTSITFADLDARANRLAALLRSRGIRDGFIGLHLERSIDYVVGVLGILKANCAVVPLPPSYPESRLREILGFAELDAVVDDDSSRIDASLSARVIHLCDAERCSPETGPLSPADPDQPAYVLSSSGSTGRPKMIVRSHRSFFHRLRWTWERHPFEVGEACAQKSHMTTTHAIYELFEPLLRGVPVYIIPDDEIRHLESFWDTLAQHAISRLLIVPSMLQASLDMPSFAPPPMNVLVLMGEHVPSRLAGRVIDAFPAPTRIFSIYGSTEASSTLVCDVRASFRPGEELPLGKPISRDVRALVLDDALEPASPGDTGMLYISGSALFSGYYKDPALTASVFVDCDGERLYRTQDQVRILLDGDLQFVGRVDDTVKIRGFRVDLGDVERAIAAHPAVRQCAVLPIGDAGRASSLVAFVTPASAAARGVLQTAREKLPSHMVPAAVVSLDALPLTASGKVDRRRLLSEYAAQLTDVEGDFESDSERQVASVWRDVLGHGRFSRESSFFEIGGTSLHVFAVVYRLRTMLSLERTALADLAVYRHPTLAGLASYIDDLREGRTPLGPTTDAILVTLKRGTDANLPPLFLISSAGGTLGAYAKVVKALGSQREVIGVRDPFLWGDRDPTLGFQAWVTRYVDAILGRQDRGPYYLAAYSSAGAFGYEIARRLRALGRDVALLALIDPLALDRASKRRFGYWALEARFRRRPFSWMLRVAGQLRRAIPDSILDRSSRQPSDWTLSRNEFDQFALRTRNDCDHIRRLSALLELNTDLPFSLTASELSSAGPERCVRLLLEKVEAVAPETDLETVENLVVQYELQVRSHHNYRLRPYDGTVCLFEPAGPYRGLESAQIRPYVRKLREWSFEVGSASNERTVLNEAFPDRIRTHYLSMRDDVFAERLATQLDVLLQPDRDLV